MKPLDDAVRISNLETFDFRLTLRITATIQEYEIALFHFLKCFLN